MRVPLPAARKTAVIFVDMATTLKKRIKEKWSTVEKNEGFDKRHICGTAVRIMPGRIISGTDRQKLDANLVFHPYSGLTGRALRTRSGKEQWQLPLCGSYCL